MLIVGIYKTEELCLHPFFCIRYTHRSPGLCSKLHMVWFNIDNVLDHNRCLYLTLIFHLRSGDPSSQNTHKPHKT